MQSNTQKRKSSRPGQHTMQAAYSPQQFRPSQSQLHISQYHYSQDYVPEGKSSSWEVPTSMPDSMGFSLMGYLGASFQDYDNGLPFELSIDSQKALPLQTAPYHTEMPREPTQPMNYPRASPCFKNISMPRSRQADFSGIQRGSSLPLADWNKMDFQVDWSHLSKSWEVPQGPPQNSFNSSIMSSPMTGNESAPSECGRSSVDIDIARHCSTSAPLAPTKEKSRNAPMSKISQKLSMSSKQAKGEKSYSKNRDEQQYPCLVEGCTKKFSRKTDLERHNKSVHIKERNHECTYCGRLFARKDTLRRHMGDGCSKRFDIETVTLQPQEPQQVFWTSSAMSSSMHSTIGSTLPDAYL